MKKLILALALALAGSCAFAQQQIVNIGSGPNSGNGDPLRTAYQKLNNNDSQLYGMFGVTGVLKGNGSVPNPFTAAAAADIIALFSGCGPTLALGGGGSCISVGGGATISITAGTGLVVSPNPITGTGSISLAVPVTVPEGGSGATTLSGVLLGNGTSPFTAAAAADIANLWSGCSSPTTMYLRADGNCQVPGGGGGGGTVTSVAMTAPTSLFSVGGTPITGGGTLALTYAAGQPTHQVIGTGSSGTMGPITLTSADVPAANLATAVGNLAVTNLNSGTGASSSTCWHGNATWGTCGAGSSAAPTALVGLTAITGSTGNFMDAGSAPALNPAISPTMTGNWTHTPVTGVGLTLNAPANSYAALINGSSTSGQSYGEEILAGTTSADYGFAVLNAAGTHVHEKIAGDGSFALGFNGTSTTLSGSATGNLTITPSTGTPLTLLAGSSTYGLQITAPSGQTAGIALAGNGTTIGNTDLNLYQDGSSVGHVRMNGAFALDLDTDAINRISIGSAGNVTINAPASGNTTNIYGAANSVALRLFGSSTTNESFGEFIQAGTSASDYGLKITNYANTLTLFEVDGTGAASMQSCNVQGAPCTSGAAHLAAGNFTTNSGACAVNLSVTGFTSCVSSSTGHAQLSLSAMTSGVCTASGANGSYIASVIGTISSSVIVVQLSNLTGTNVDGQFSVTCIGN